MGYLTLSKEKAVGVPNVPKSEVIWVPYTRELKLVKGRKYLVKTFHDKVIVAKYSPDYFGGFRQDERGMRYSVGEVEYVAHINLPEEPCKKSTTKKS